MHEHDFVPQGFPRDYLADDDPIIVYVCLDCGEPGYPIYAH